jgi:predicted nucleic acid-binding protein
MRIPASGSAPNEGPIPSARVELFVLLDSTVLIDFLRGRPAEEAVRGLRQSGDTPCTTAINVEEVVRGLRPEEEGAGRALVQGLQVVPIGRRDGWQAGRWRREFSARGVTLSQADCLIAAAAHSIGTKLATGNPDDFPMSGLIVEHWPVGR